MNKQKKLTSIEISFTRLRGFEPLTARLRRPLLYPAELKPQHTYVMAEKEGFEPSRRLPDLHP